MFVTAFRYHNYNTYNSNLTGEAFVFVFYISILIAMSMEYYRRWAGLRSETLWPMKDLVQTVLP